MNKHISRIFKILVIGLLLGIGLNNLHRGVVILHYHAVNNVKNSYEEVRIFPDDFEWEMAYLKRFGYNVISLEETVDYLKNNTKIPSKAIAITFDDGYTDNYTEAYPILIKHNYPATIFLATGNIGGENGWDIKRGLPKMKLMTWDQIKEMNKSNIISFQPHTVNHYNVTKISAQEAMEQLQESKKVVEKELGKSADFFAFPYGSLNQDVVELVEKAGYKAAFTSSPGYNVYNKADIYRIRRMSVKEAHSGFWGRILFAFELKLRSLVNI